MSYTLVNQVSSIPLNSNVGYNNSWLKVENDANRELFAQASYVTNFDDLTISLSAGNVNIGGVEIKDWNSDLRADVTTSDGLNALRVLSQDLESSVDDITIGDREGNLTTVNPYNSSLYVSVADGPIHDAFGRLRTSQPDTLVDAKHLYNKLPNLFDEVVAGNATSVFVQNDSLVLMSTVSENDYVIRQSWNHYNYEPGKSLQAFFTFVAPKQVDSVKRIGLFQGLSAAPYEPSDGIFLEVTGDNAYFRMVKTLGTNHSMTIPQSAWNVDRFDGTGKSGLNIDFSKSQIFTIDYEWLGVGRTRLGFVFNGHIYYAHYENHYNNITAPYITSPNQPIRYEIRQTGASAGNLKHICSTVIVEGGESATGQSLSVATSAAVSVDSTNYKPILFFRSNPIAHDATSYIKQFDFINLDQYAVHFVLLSLKNSNLRNTLNWTDGDSSSIQYAIGNTQSISLSSGTNIYGGYISGSGQNKVTTSSSSSFPEKIARLGIGINGVEEIYTVVAKAFGGTTTVLGSINLIERT